MKIIKIKKRFPIYVLQSLKKARKKGGNPEPIILPDKVYADWTWDSIKDTNMERLKDPKVKRFVLFPNNRELIYPKIELKQTEEDVMLCSKGKRENTFYFIEDYIDKKVTVTPIAKLKAYPYFIVSEKEYSKAYSICQLDTRKTYWANSMKYEIPVSPSKGENVFNKKYIILKVEEKKEDYSPIMKLKFNDIQDLSLCWNYQKNERVFSDIEVFIILADIFYCESGVPALDLMLCGPPSTKKTVWALVAREIFGDEIITSANMTLKSLVPSFYGSQPRPGVLLDSKFVSLLDDFLRYYDQMASVNHIGKLESLSNGLGQIFNILDRNKKTLFPSGKGDFSGQYSASFFGTDNLKYKQDFMQLWNQDPAVLRRFSFLITSDDTNKRGKESYTPTSEAIPLIQERFKKLGLSFSKYRLLGLYLREKMCAIKFNTEQHQMIKDIANKIKDTYGEDFHMEVKIRAMMKFYIAIKEFIPSLLPNMLADAIDRLGDDFAKVVGIGKMNPEDVMHV